MPIRRYQRNSYSATSLQNFLDCMRLSKSSLYQSFGNKEALLISCIDHYQTAFNQKLSELLKASTSGLGFIAQLLESVIREANDPERKGCLLVNTVNELGGCPRIEAVARES
ncbi:MAG: TetR/AcrR family transcriptional regulator, partial [Gammaproteobacteria bacterium]|nr:TetR/AcrR family transcriptional regulator [Gammaproteobacteria bacterium]